MDRTKFFNTEIIDEKAELDFLNTYISKFQMTYQPIYYRVSEDDLMRPDMISYKVYGTVKYWWLIMAVNDIFNPLLDLYVGQRLIIPNIVDIYEFYKKYSMR